MRAERLILTDDDDDDNVHSFSCYSMFGREICASAIIYNPFLHSLRSVCLCLF